MGQESLTIAILANCYSPVSFMTSSPPQDLSPHPSHWHDNVCIWGEGNTDMQSLALCHRATAFPNFTRPEPDRCPLPPPHTVNWDPIVCVCVCVCVCIMQSPYAGKEGGGDRGGNLKSGVCSHDVLSSERERRQELVGK